MDCSSERCSRCVWGAHQELCIDDASQMYCNAHRTMRARFCVEHIVCPEAGGGNKSGCSNSGLPPSTSFIHSEVYNPSPRLTPPPSLRILTRYVFRGISECLLVSVGVFWHLMQHWGVLTNVSRCFGLLEVLMGVCECEGSVHRICQKWIYNRRTTFSFLITLFGHGYGLFTV